MSVKRAYGGVSANVRLAQRRAALVAVALERIAEDGTEAITVRSVCAGAKLNQRYFYESFADRDALLYAAFDAAWAEVRTTMRDAATAASARGKQTPKELACAAIEAYLSMVIDPPYHGRLLMIEAQGEPALRARRRDFIAEIADFIAGQAQGWLGLPEAQERDLRPTAIMVVGAGHELVQHWHSGGIEMTTGELVETLADAWMTLFAVLR